MTSQKMTFVERKRRAEEIYGVAEVRPQDIWRKFLISRRKINYGQQIVLSHPHLNLVQTWEPTHKMMSFDEKELTEIKSITIVDSSKIFYQMEQDLLECDTLVIDTEGHDEHSYAGMICLIQIASKSMVYLVDPFPIIDLIKTRLKAILESSSKMIIMHGADNDILWIKRDFNIHLVSVMDTQHYHQILNRGDKIGFQYLVNFYSPGLTQEDNVRKKVAQCADFRLRPLPKALQQYAAEDVSKLKVVWAVIKRRENGHEFILKAVKKTKPFLLATGGAKTYPTAEKELQSLRKKVHLTPNQLERFKVLWDWRQYHAKAMDENPRLLIPTQSLVRISKKKSMQESELIQTLYPFPKTLQKSKSTILKLISDGRTFLNKIQNMICNNCERTGHAAFACFEEYCWKNTKRYYDNHPELKTAQNKRRHQNARKNKQARKQNNQTS